MQAHDLDLKPPCRARIGFALVIAVLHLALLYGLMRVFAPGFTQATINKALSVFTVTVPPPASPPAKPMIAPDEGAAGNAGRKAVPREVAAPKVLIPIRPAPAPPLAATGPANSAGAAEQGVGTGAGGDGNGPGSGGGGGGQGSMAVRGVEKIGGDINSARDYPKATRDRRIGQSVTVILAVGADGRVSDCRISQPSPDVEADAITCRLASERFRFRPAMDAAGNAVPGKYAWRQRWFY